MLLQSSDECHILSWSKADGGMITEKEIKIIE